MPSFITSTSKAEQEQVTAHHTEWQLHACMCQDAYAAVGSKVTFSGGRQSAWPAVDAGTPERHARGPETLR